MRIRTLIPLLILCVILLCVPVGVSAAVPFDSGKFGENECLTWVLDTDGTLTISGNGRMDDYMYEERDEDGYWVPSRYLNRYTDHIKRVVIEKGVTYIGDRAFERMKYMEELIIPDSVTEIGWRAFRDCDSLTKIQFGNGLIRTEDELFFDCDALKSVTLPSIVEEWGKYTFAECDVLSEVILPDGLTKISEYMFAECVKLGTIDIPNTVTEIAGCAFETCIALTKIEIPSSVEIINNRAFRYCHGLRSVEIPGNVKSLGEGAFESCENLNSLVLNEGLEYIGSNLLHHNYKVKSLTIPSTVKELSHTFAFAYGLESITFLGDSPDRASAMFNGITTTVYYPGNNETWTQDYRQDYWGTITWIPYESEKLPDTPIASGVGEDGISWTLTRDYTLIISGTGPMKDYGFYDAPWHDWAEKRIEHIIIEPGVTQIGQCAFLNCVCVKTISIPDTVEIIGKNAFGGCRSITELVIPKSVKEIGGSAFSSTVALEHVFFLGDAPKMEVVFGYDGNNATVRYPANNSTWTEEVRKAAGENINWLVDDYPHTYEAVVIEPSCTEQGYTTYICGTCGDHYEEDNVDATGHSWTLKKTLSCANCGMIRKAYKINVDLDETTGKPVISWESASGVKNYEIYRATSEDGKYTKIKTTKALSYMDTDAKIDTTYYYKIRAVASSSSANSIYSDIKSILCVAPQPQILYGDADANGVVNAKDAMLVLQYYTRKIDESKLALAACDVDGNKTVNAKDAMLILQFYTKKITKFPIES